MDVIELLMFSMTKREQINFRLSDELNEILREKCEELGITKSDFAKRALLNALGIPTNVSSQSVRVAIADIQARLIKVEESLEISIPDRRSG